MEILAEKYNLKLILLFGSSVTGEIHSESDIDIAVYGDEILSEADKINLICYIGGLFHTSLVDLVDLKTAPPLLRKEIFANYRALYLKDSILLHQLESTAINEFKESAVLYQLRHERLEASIR